MPDLFFCHNSDAAKLGAENLLNWNDYFTESERADFVSDFLADGIVDEKLVVFPVSKSTHVLYISDREFSRFSAATLREPNFGGYYDKIGALYANLRKEQTTMPDRVNDGESADALAEEPWELFRAAK